MLAVCALAVAGHPDDVNEAGYELDPPKTMHQKAPNFLSRYLDTHVAQIRTRTRQYLI